MNKAESRQCQNCKNRFAIEPDDFAFYEKIKVPPPTWCPECRLLFRLMWRNERSLYKRACGLCGKEVLTMYGPDSGIIMYCNPCWWSDKWDPTAYGRDYDFDQSFFDQFNELMRTVPHAALSVNYSTLVNSDYNNMNHELKNCYWLFNSDYDENCWYGEEVEGSKDCMDVTMIDGSELMYGSVNCVKCNRVFNSVDCEGCHDVWFSRNLSNCSNCFGCVNLRGKQSHVFNKPYSKEEYGAEVKKLLSGSYADYQKYISGARDFWRSFPRRYMHGTHNTDVSGDYITYSKNVKDSYIVTAGKDCRYCMWLIVKTNESCYDCTQFGENLQNVYQIMSCGAGVSNLVCGIFSAFDVRDSAYVISCWGSSNLFGCVGLRKKHNYVLNKEYSPEEYVNLITEIKSQMTSMPFVDSKSRVFRYGDFFPIVFSPFRYNETTANEYFPLSKERVLEHGFSWKDPERREYDVSVAADNLPDKITEVPDSITKEIISCLHRGKCNEQCATAFRVLPKEIEFYRRFNLPLPRLCPNCRHAGRITERNPVKLWPRRCECAGAQSENSVYKNVSEHFHKDAHCPNEFETSYPPESPAIVYCETCYQSEVV